MTTALKHLSSWLTLTALTSFAVIAVFDAATRNLVIG